MTIFIGNFSGRKKELMKNFVIYFLLFSLIRTFAT